MSSVHDRRRQGMHSCITPPDCPNTWGSFGGDERECRSISSSSNKRVKKRQRESETKEKVSHILPLMLPLSHLYTQSHKRVMYPKITQEKGKQDQSRKKKTGQVPGVLEQVTEWVHCRTGADQVQAKHKDNGKSNYHTTWCEHPDTNLN